MTRIELKSKMIDAVEYDPVSQRLTAYFANGQLRKLEGVPEGVVVGLATAASPGDYYMSEIRGKYRSL